MKLVNPLTSAHSFSCRNIHRPGATPADAIRLKPVKVKDASRILALMTEDIYTRLAISPVTNLAEAKHFLLGEGSTHKERHGICHPQAGLIGTVGYGLSGEKGWQSATISYWLGSDWRGKGYGSQALTLLLNHLNELGVSRFSAQVYAFNTPSQELLLKFGFRRTKGNSIACLDDDMAVLDFCRID